MLVSVKLQLEDSGILCGRCGQYRGLYANVRTDAGTGRLGPLCLLCLNQEESVFVQPLETVRRGPPTKRMKRLSKRQDRQIAEGIGARVQKASGATAANKGDIRKAGRLRIETKYTFARSFRVEHSVLQKIRGECTGLEQPVVVIDFKEKHTGLTYDRWAVVPHQEWEKLINETDDDQ